MLTTNLATSYLLDLDAPLSGYLTYTVPPLADRRTADAERHSEGSDAAKATDRNDDSGVDLSVHGQEPKAILAELQALPPCLCGGHCSDAMSGKTSGETEELAERIRAAFLICGKHQGDVKNAISQELGISRQAIDGWLRTGRIGKSRLAVIARHTGQSLDYFLGLADMTAQEETEVALIQQYRALPDVLRQKLLADAKSYAELVQQAAAAKPGKPTKR